MKPDAATTAAVCRFLRLLAKHYDFVSGVLYGSRARGTHKSTSDADVAILLNGQAGEFVETKLAMDDLAYEVLLETGIRISPLPIWMAEWDQPDKYSNPALLHNIKNEGITIHPALCCHD